MLDASFLELRDNVKNVFSERHLRLKAFETGFCKRLSKFSPLMFLDNLFYDATSTSAVSLNQCAVHTKKKYDVDISKQGFSNRFTEGSLKYVQSLIGEVISHQISSSIDTGWFNLFTRVLIKDSTKFDVSPNLAAQFPGSGGHASKAAVSVQNEFDIKSGTTNDLDITAANQPDTNDTLAKIQKVRKGDLIIRDLGYSILACFMAMHKIGAYFISRLNVKMVVYEMVEGTFSEIDFGKLLQDMKKGNFQRLDKPVFIGKNEKFPVRLIIEIMPEDVVKKRLQKANAQNKKEGYKTSENYKNRAHFNLFITNIEDEKLEAHTITKIYRIRWQVELIFKAWKSTFGINTLNPLKYERLICLLNARLLIIALNWNIFMQKRTQLYVKTGKLLSINKCFKTIHENSIELKDILTNNCQKLTKWVKMITKLFETHHWLEKKKNRIGLEEIFLLNT